MDILSTEPEPIMVSYDIYRRFDPLTPMQYASTASSVVDSGLFYETKRVKTPDFMARKKRGELLPFTFFEQTRHQVKMMSEPTGFLYDDGTSFFQNAIGPGWWGTNIIPSTFDPDELKGEYLASYAMDLDSYVQKAAEKLYRGFDALTFAAELKKSARMLQGTLPKITKFTSRLPKTVDLANLWLEGRYGWRPLYYDIVELHKTLEGVRLTARILKDVAGFTTMDIVEIPPHTFYSTVWGDSVLTGTLNMAATVKVGVRGTVAARFPTPLPVTANAALTAWELIPYSFVYDWVVDVSKWICAQSLMLQASETQACSGLLCRIEGSPIAILEATGHGSFKNPTSVGEYLYEYNIRTPQSIPQSPILRPNLDVAKLVDLVALLINARAGGGRSWK